MRLPSNRSLVMGIAVCIGLFGVLHVIKHSDTTKSPDWHLKSAEKVFDEYHKTPVQCISQYPRKGITLRWCARTPAKFEAMKARMEASGDLTSDMIVDDRASYPKQPRKGKTRIIDNTGKVVYETGR